MKRIKVVLCTMVLSAILLVTVSAEDFNTEMKKLIDIIRNEYKIEAADTTIRDFVDYYELTLDDIYESNVLYLFDDFIQDYDGSIENTIFIDDQLLSDSIKLNELEKIQFISNENSDIAMIAIDLTSSVKYYGGMSSIYDIEEADAATLTEEESREIIDKLQTFEIESWDDEYLSSDDGSTGWYSFTILLEDKENNVKKITGSGVSGDNLPPYFGDFQKMMWDLVG